MASFDILYTGRDAGIKIPDFDKLEKAESNFYGNIVKGAELQFKKGEEREADFLTSMKNDPVLLISDANRKRQAAALESYNNTYGALYAKRGGNLTMQDKIKQQSDREALLMTQDSMVADEKRFQAEKAIMDKDIKGFYNTDRFAAAAKTFFETGKYPTTGLVANPQEFVSRLQKMKGHGELRTVRAKDGSTVDYETNMTLDEAKDAVVSELMSNQGSLMKAITDFNAQPEAEIAKYFEDTNQNGIIDPAEKKSQLDQPRNLNNPILKWAQDFYGVKVRTENPGPSKNHPSGGSGSKGYFGTDKDPLKERENVVLGTTTYEKYYSKVTPLRVSIPLTGGRVLDGLSGDYALDNDKTVQGLEFTGVGVNKTTGKTEFTFKLPSDNWDNIMEAGGTNLSFPADKNPEFLEAFIVTKDGKRMQVKELVNTKGSAEVKKQIKRGDITSKAKAAGYTAAEYEKMLRDRGVEIVN